MPKVRYLKLRFDQNIFPYDIPRFRAAVIEKTQRESELFHNHKGDDGFAYRYPLIQYKVTQRKASIICLNEGADEIHHLLQNRDMTLRVGHTVQDYSIEDIELHHHEVQVWDNSFEYSLLNWMALNQEHYRRWQSLESDETAQLDLLNGILRGNILAFAKGIGWFVEDRIVVEISRIREIKPLSFKGRDMPAFSLHFRSNVSLPDYIGLGKGVSVGFGVVRNAQ
jgi:hypothetical protein